MEQPNQSEENNPNQSAQCDITASQETVLQESEFILGI